jgi:hypothetical protein
MSCLAFALASWLTRRLEPFLRQLRRAAEVATCLQSCLLAAHTAKKCCHAAEELGGIYSMNPMSGRPLSAVVSEMERSIPYDLYFYLIS